MGYGVFTPYGAVGPQDAWLGFDLKPHVAQKGLYLLAMHT